jgi:protein O-mannosyl-transferase
MLQNWLKRNYKSLLILSLFVLIAYINTLQNQFLSDDISGILNNHQIGNLSHLAKNPYGFLRDLFYYFIFKIGGLHPFLFHIFNLMVHLGTTIIVFILIGLLVNFQVAITVASLFALHPLQAEAITWISGGPYSQYSFFLLLSFLFYILAKRKNDQKFLLVSIFTYILSLLSTEKGAIFPIILIIYEWAYGDLKLSWRKIIPYFGLSVLWFFFFLFGGAIGGRVSALQSNYYQEPGWENPFIQIPVAISSYLNLIFFPIGLTLYHSEEMILSTPIYIIRLAVFVIYLSILAICAKKNRKYFFWLSFFFISLWPVLTPLRISWVVAERYVYLGTIGIYVFIAMLIEKISKKYHQPNLFLYILLFLLPILGFMTIQRNYEWKNQDSLWLAAAKTSPSSPQNHNNLGDYYARYGNFPKAIEEFSLAVRIKPNYGDAYHNLANIYYQTKQYNLALDNYRRALSTNPNLWQTHQNIASIYFDLKQYNLAIEEIKKALVISPNYSDLHRTLGVLYLVTKDFQKAKIEFQTAISLNPQDQTSQQYLLSL